MPMHQRVYESKQIADEYIKYRPRYTAKARHAIMDYLSADKNDDSKYNFMMEVGCGSGQATNMFAAYFDRVYATDISEAQIERAKKQNQFTNVVYDIGCAEELIGVDDKSVDLLLSATSAHWFDLPRFFNEASRVLKPDGCLAISCYGLPTLWPHSSRNNKSLSKELDDLLYHYISHGKCHNLKAYEEIFGGYRNIFQAIPGSQKERRNVEIVYEDWSLADVKGFIQSTDAYQLYMEHVVKTHGGKITDEELAALDSAEIFGRKVKELLNVQDTSENEILFRVVFDCYILLSKPF